MRYDTPVYFQIVTSGEYDDATGDYKDSTTSEIMRFANVTDAGTSTVGINFGKLKQGSKAVRIKGIKADNFDRIRIGDKLYTADNVITREGKWQVFIVSEVQ